jgi:uncharacterized oxidoreductase
MCLKDRLLSAGHRVIALSRTASTLPPHKNLETIDCNLAVPSEVLDVASSLIARQLKIGVLLNNAALQYAVPLTDVEFKPSSMIAEAHINLVAPALFAHALMPVLQRFGPGAAIVNISSGLAFHPKRASALYCATKAGLHSFSRSLRYQLEGTDIRVIEAILPLVATPMTEGRGTGKMAADDVAQAILAGMASGKEEVFIGKARLLKILDRFAPAIPAKILKGS